MKVEFILEKKDWKLLFSILFFCIITKWLVYKPFRMRCG